MKMLTSKLIVLHLAMKIVRYDRNIQNSRGVDLKSSTTDCLHNSLSHKTQTVVFLYVFSKITEGNMCYNII